MRAGMASLNTTPLGCGAFVRLWLLCLAPARASFRRDPAGISCDQLAAERAGPLRATERPHPSPLALPRWLHPLPCRRRTVTDGGVWSKGRRRQVRCRRGEPRQDYRFRTRHKYQVRGFVCTLQPARPQARRGCTSVRLQHVTVVVYFFPQEPRPQTQRAAT